MYCLGAEGLEILRKQPISMAIREPTDAWIEKLVPPAGEIPAQASGVRALGRFRRLYPGRELSTKESYEMLLRDIKLASKLGFSFMRTHSVGP